MSSEWPTYHLSQLCILVVDCPHSTPVWTDSGKVVLRNQNIKGGRLDLSAPSFTDEDHFIGRIRRARPTAGDIVITREAPMGEVCMIPAGLECCLGQRQVLLRPDSSKVDGQFLLYALQSPGVQHQIGWNEGTGSTVSNLRIPVLESLNVAVPPLEMQKGIASVLAAVDDRITLLRETNATLEAIAQALFKSWFVDFDPVRAKLAGRAPEGMDEATAALFPDSFEDSELGDVPRGWRTGRVADVAAAIFSGGTPDTRRPDFWDGDIPWFSSGETRNFVVIQTEKAITRAGVDGSSTREARPGDVLIASAGQGHTRGQTSLCAINCFINQSVVAVRAGAQISPHWLLLNLRRRYDEMRGLSDSHSSRGSLTTKLLAGMPMVIPTASVMSSFEEVAGPLAGSLASNARLAATLESFRDTLLPRLISGQLRLPEASEVIEEALA